MAEVNIKKKVHGEQWKILKWLVTVTLCRENWNLFGQINFSLVGYFILLSQKRGINELNQSELVCHYD